MSPVEPKRIVEAALLAAGRTLSLEELLGLFEGERDAPGRADLRAALGELREECEGRCLELVEVGHGYRLQVRAEFAPWMGRLWAERPPRYSRALLETLALIAYRQPITRGEIEDVRGVAVSTSIIRTLLEREWIRVLGHREVPGRPALYGTTREFLDSFGLKSLEELPPLAEIRDLESLHADLFADLVPEQGAADPGVPPGRGAGVELAVSAAPDGAGVDAGAADAQAADAETADAGAAHPGPSDPRPSDAGPADPGPVGPGHVPGDAGGDVAGEAAPRSPAAAGSPAPDPAGRPAPGPEDGSGAR